MSSDHWNRVSQSDPCRICGKSDWCLVARDRRAAICARTESSRRCGEAGYLHRLTGKYQESPQAVRRSFEISGLSDWTRVANECQAAGGYDLPILARELGVAHTSLRQLCVGRFGPSWAFPHEDGAGRTCGIHLRAPNGRKPYVRGSRPGIAVPIQLGSCDPLIVTEGESDCAAALSLGFDAVARPGCSSSLLALMTFMRRRRPPSVVVFGDNDEAGRRGAVDVAGPLARLCSSVRIVFPRSGAKDMREWLRRGASRHDVLAVVRAATPIRLELQIESTSRKTAR